VLACPKKTLALSSRINKRGMQVVAVVEGNGCSGCGSCALMCPDAAIEISEDEVKPRTSRREARERNRIRG